MKNLLLAAALSTAALAAQGQTDSTVTHKEEAGDTIRIGSMTIIKRTDKNGSSSSDNDNNNHNYSYKWNGWNKKPKRLETSWLTMDFGYSNINDQTDYTTAEAKNYARATRPGEKPFSSGDFNLRNGKSTNFNLWLFRQRYGITRDRKMKLTYGFIIETNNYRFDTELKTSYKKGTEPYVWRDSVSFSKNKLALDYFAVPVMIGFDTKPGRGGFTMSAGVSIGYLYSSRNKQISSERDKQKIKGNFDIKPWKFQYVGEVGFGPVKLYASYTPESIYERGLDHMPYNIGIRLGDW